ncbi:MAG: sigma-54-dependent Fis family transcriptional regulator [Deltaproteobacteria bacterium]|nr:sigma-54-dependent Fis family transcriptional regulator [Deltaproteobacteria bacterium]
MTRTTLLESRDAAPKVIVRTVKGLFSPDARWRDKTVVFRRTVTMGREGGPEDIVIDDPLMSRRHAELKVVSDDGAVGIRDLESRNGTYLDGERIATDFVVLESGDVIRVGGTLLLFERFERTGTAPVERSGRLIGTNRAIQSVLAQVGVAARGVLPVLVVGETGTGKELVATEIHERSGREGRLVAVNCAAIPRDLFESAFFGHRKGSFSGASDDRGGYFQGADKGTLLLDEIGEMPLDAQAKLLRTIETMEVTPVGETRAVKVDARIVAATNRRLDDEVTHGRFRGDLLARLRGITIPLPPLRERRDDLLLLLEHFLGRAGRSLVLTADFVERFLLHRWRENVRELEHATHRLVLATRDGDTLRAADAEKILVSAAQGDGTRAGRKPDPLQETPAAGVVLTKPIMPSREALEAAFAEAGGKIVAVAAKFHTNRQQVYRWLDYLDMTIDDLRGKKS